MGLHPCLALGGHQSITDNGIMAIVILPIARFDPVCPGLSKAVSTSSETLRVSCAPEHHLFGQRTSDGR